MILTIDVGNTSITCGLFENDNLVKSFRIPSDRDITTSKCMELLQFNISTIHIDGAIIGSVVEEVNDRVFGAVFELYKVKPILLNSKTNLSITLNVKNNAEVGADRIANAVKAWEIYKKSVIVVDFGTATTFDIVNSKGEFIGGIIAPGIITQLNSLFQATSKLPKIEIKPIEKTIANDTESSILSGVVIGSASMVDGMIERCEKELNERPVIIGTGGLCEVVAQYMTKKFDNIYNNLTLAGLLSIYKNNQ